MVRLLFWASAGLVVYVYFGYPVLVDLVSRWRGVSHDPPQAPDQLPTVTVIIPAHNEERWIARKIENTLALVYPSSRLQVLLASDGCTDNTLNIARQYAERGVETNHSMERSGKMATLNRVVPEALGEIILITDCNALLPPEALLLLVRHYQDPDVGCVTGDRVCVHTGSSASEGEGLYWRYEAWIKKSESKLGSCLGSNGQVLTVRKALFPHIPDVSDDFYVPMKILVSTGAQVRFEPRVKAMIPAAANLGLELERKIRTHVALLRHLPYLKEGLNPLRGGIWWRFLSHHVLRMLVPFALLLALLSSAYLSRTAALFRIITVCQGVFYAASITGYAFARCGLRWRVVYVPFYFAFANLGVFLAWIRWARGKHQYAWQRTERIAPTDAQAAQFTPWGK
jgi:glycosyltransferase involved in cell wall biosynthesis